MKYCLGLLVIVTSILCDDVVLDLNNTEIIQSIEDEKVILEWDDVIGSIRYNIAVKYRYLGLTSGFSNMIGGRTTGLITEKTKRRVTKSQPGCSLVTYQVEFDGQSPRRYPPVTTDVLTPIFDSSLFFNLYGFHYFIGSNITKISWYHSLPCGIESYTLNLQPKVSGHKIIDVVVNGTYDERITAEIETSKLDICTEYIARISARTHSGIVLESNAYEELRRGGICPGDESRLCPRWMRFCEGNLDVSDLQLTHIIHNGSVKLEWIDVPGAWGYNINTKYKLLGMVNSIDYASSVKPYRVLYGSQVRGKHRSREAIRQPECSLVEYSLTVIDDDDNEIPTSDTTEVLTYIYDTSKKFRKFGYKQESNGNRTILTWDHTLACVEIYIVTFQPMVDDVEVIVVEVTPEDDKVRVETTQLDQCNDYKVRFDAKTFLNKIVESESTSKIINSKSDKECNHHQTITGSVDRHV